MSFHIQCSPYFQSPDKALFSIFISVFPFNMICGIYIRFELVIAVRLCWKHTQKRMELAQLYGRKREMKKNLMSQRSSQITTRTKKNPFSARIFFCHILHLILVICFFFFVIDSTLTMELISMQRLYIYKFQLCIVFFWHLFAVHKFIITLKHNKVNIVI